MSWLWLILGALVLSVLLCGICTRRLLYLQRRQVSSDAEAASLFAARESLIGEDVDTLEAMALDQQQTHDVFLSYRRCDVGVVERLANKLRLAGISVFLDRLGFMSGTPFATSLVKELSHCSLFIAVITPTVLSQLSAPTPPEEAGYVDWVLVEYILATHFQAAGLASGHRQLTILPLLVGTEAEAAHSITAPNQPRSNEVLHTAIRTVSALLASLSPPQELLPTVEELAVYDARGRLQLAGLLRNQAYHLCLEEIPSAMQMAALVPHVLSTLAQHW